MELPAAAAAAQAQAARGPRKAKTSCGDCGQSPRTMRSGLTFHVCANPECGVDKIGKNGSDPGISCFCARCLIGNYKLVPEGEYSLGGRKPKIVNAGVARATVCPRCRGLEGAGRKRPPPAEGGGGRRSKGPKRRGGASSGDESGARGGPLPLSPADAPKLSWCKLPPPDAPARPPPGSAIRAEFEQGNVVRLDIREAVTRDSFTGERRLAEPDHNYVMQLIDDADVSVIIKGLAAELTPELWTWDYLLQRCGHVVWKKVRVFERTDDSEHWHERGWKTMSLHDYHEYLLRRQAGDKDALSVVWYWIDFPLKEFLPELFSDFQNSAPLDLFPAGRHCAQQWVSAGSRPDMGPNLYITPPGGRTWFHEDGNGTVDSGHQCMTGRNEVVMLRRITDVPTRLNAMHKLNGAEGVDHARPHDDAVLSTAAKKWPTEETLGYLRDELHAGPSHIVLGPGEFLHIGKGRMHAFRKMAPERAETAEDICISVAWDWMYQGYASTGIAQETETVAHNGRLNQVARRESLSIFDSTLAHGALSRLGHLRAVQAVHKLAAHSLVGAESKAFLDNRADGEDLTERHSQLALTLRAECAAVEPFVSNLDKPLQHVGESSQMSEHFHTRAAIDNKNRTPRLLTTSGSVGDRQRAQQDISRVDAFTSSSMGDQYNPDAFDLSGCECRASLSVRSCPRNFLTGRCCHRLVRGVPCRAT